MLIEPEDTANPAGVVLFGAVVLFTFVPVLTSLRRVNRASWDRRTETKKRMHTRKGVSDRQSS